MFRDKAFPNDKCGNGQKVFPKTLGLQVDSTWMLHLNCIIFGVLPRIHGWSSFHFQTMVPTGGNSQEKYDVCPIYKTLKKIGLSASPTVHRVCDCNCWPWNECWVRIQDCGGSPNSKVSSSTVTQWGRGLCLTLNTPSLGDILQPHKTGSKTPQP